mgnify:CR=1 FL=1
MSDFSNAWPDWGKWVLLGLLLSLAQAAFMLRRESRRREAGRRDARRRETIRVSGQSSTARITAARDTNKRIGETLYYVIELTVDVAATSCTPAFTRTLEVPLSPLNLANFGVGKTIQVRVDPSTRELAVDQPT